MRKQLSEELEIPDLKYWQLDYNRSDECFYLIVESIEFDADDVWGENAPTWQEKISKEEMVENLLDDDKFRNLIANRLRKIAPIIKKDKSKPKDKSWKEKLSKAYKERYKK